MNRLGCVLAVFCFVLILGVTTGCRHATGQPPPAPVIQPLTLTEAIEQVSPSIVQISVLLVDLSESTARTLGVRSPLFYKLLGTGFLVSDEGYVLTARHVVKEIESLQARRKELSVGIPLPNTDNIRGNFSMVPVELVDQDAEHDLALLRLSQNPFRGEVAAPIQVAGKRSPLNVNVAKLSPRRPQDGEAIAVSGYPLNQRVLITTSGVVASSWSHDLQQAKPPGTTDWFRLPDIADSYLADLRVNPGNSGGPVYAIKTGAVIGVCVAFNTAIVQYADGQQERAIVGGRPLVYNSGVSIIVPIRYAVELLAKHNVKWRDR